MAENENTFVILQSLLTCVCERENHGSTKGEWGIANGEMEKWGIEDGRNNDLTLNMAENENTFQILQSFSLV